MTESVDDRRREYPGDRFSKRIIEQNLNEVAGQLRQEEFSEGHLEQGHNQIELYRQNGTTVSLFVFDKDGQLPEHAVEDGSVMIQVLEGKLRLETEDPQQHLQPDEASVLVLESGMKHSIRAEQPSTVLVTIMRE